jgi:hypothetical protein
VVINVCEEMDIRVNYVEKRCVEKNEWMVVGVLEKKDVIVYKD